MAQLYHLCAWGSLRLTPIMMGYSTESSMCNSLCAREQNYNTPSHISPKQPGISTLLLCDVYYVLLICIYTIALFIRCQDVMLILMEHYGRRPLKHLTG